MSKAMERYKQEIYAEAFQEGKLEGFCVGYLESYLNTLVMMTKQLIEKGYSDDFILSLSGVTEEILMKAKKTK